MIHPTIVVNIAGLSRSLLGEDMPCLAAFAAGGGTRLLQPVLPAVTCSVQSSMLTGLPVSAHGIVGNGWFDRTLQEVHFWKQSNRLVAGDKVWDAARARDASVTTANMFWWFNMGSSVDYSVTPRPLYRASGLKIPDIATVPTDLRDQLQDRFGTFPLLNFWGPGASIRSSQWIAEAAFWILEQHHPSLTLLYLPHLDYALQQHGPGSEEACASCREIDTLFGIVHERARALGLRVMVISEYGIEAVDMPVTPNRALREAGLLHVRDERGGEHIDLTGSRAFAIVDHQVAHIYINDPADIEPCRDVLAALPGVAQVLDAGDQATLDCHHARSGDLLLVAAPGAWFAWPYWLDDAAAPDFARTVDIHRKPGYDPCELLMDPTMLAPRLHVMTKLLARRLGFRTLLDVIPLDPGLVRGSHGRVDVADDQLPVLLTGEDRAKNGPEKIPCTQVRDEILAHLLEA